MASIFVTMTDKSISQHGFKLQKINKIIFICESWLDAQTVEQNGIAHDSMKFINIAIRKPYYNSVRYYAEYRNKKNFPKWYRPNGIG